MRRPPVSVFNPFNSPTKGTKVTKEAVTMPRFVSFVPFVGKFGYARPRPAQPDRRHAGQIQPLDARPLGPLRPAPDARERAADPGAPVRRRRRAAGRAGSRELQ